MQKQELKLSNTIEDLFVVGKNRNNVPVVIYNGKTGLIHYTKNHDDVVKSYWMNPYTYLQLTSNSKDDNIRLIICDLIKYFNMMEFSNNETN